VRAAPIEGKANAALEALVAKALGVGKGRVSIARGDTSRVKTLEIEGMTDEEVRALLK
jgi:uncharacterized protein YggU (UPF0235/DUF167 family)